MKKRQDKANREYKIRKAETEASRIMQERQKKLQGNWNSTGLRKRYYSPFLEEGYDVVEERESTALSDYLENILKSELE